MSKHLIYLASGNAARFGSNKLLQVLEGKPLYRHGLDQLVKLLQEEPDCDLTVVSRHPEIREAVQALGLRAVDAPESIQGMSYSIKAGIQAVEPCEPDDFLMFICADQPRLRWQSVQKLLRQAVPGTRVARLCSGDTDGNPVLFSAELIPQLLELTGDSGGKAVICRYPCVRVQAESPRELQDIDTEADFRSQQEIKE